MLKRFVRTLGPVALLLTTPLAMATDWMQDRAGRWHCYSDDSDYPIDPSHCYAHARWGDNGDAYGCYPTGSGGALPHGLAPFSTVDPCMVDWRFVNLSNGERLCYPIDEFGTFPKGHPFAADNCN